MSTQTLLWIVISSIIRSIIPEKLFSCFHKTTGLYIKLNPSHALVVSSNQRAKSVNRAKREFTVWITEQNREILVSLGPPDFALSF